MTRASEMCSGCGCEIDASRGSFCEECVWNGTALRLSGFEAAPCFDRCPACSRLIASDGSCGCMEGCAPGAARKGRALEWLLLGAAVLAVLVLVAERLMWIL